MRQSRGRGSKVETEARLCEAKVRQSQLKKTASRPPQAEADASRTPSLPIGHVHNSDTVHSPHTEIIPKGQ